MNELNLKINEALNTYFANIAEAMKDFNEGDHEYATKKYYITGFKAFYEIIQQKYENKYSLNPRYASIRNKKVEPKIYIKDNPKITADNGIFIYISLSNNNDAKLNISLELGKNNKYANKDSMYEKVLAKLRQRYKTEIEQITNKLTLLDGLNIINNRSIFNIEITNFNNILPVLELLELAYDKIIADIKSYHSPDNNWTIAWKKYQEQALDEVYIKEENEVGSNHIYYGIPGCGKSKYIELKYGLNKYNSTRITFHPDYTNSDFIGQIIPKRDPNDDKIIHYDFEPGPFTKALENALSSNEPYYLVIEEINRGNASAIFGDIFQILDRKEDGTSEYEIDNDTIIKYLKKDDIPKVFLPANLFILATMNTNDQNVYPLDTAFKRRWEMHLITNDFQDNPYDNELKDMLVPHTTYTWEYFKNKINEAILEKTSTYLNNEDKQIGKYFVTKKELVNPKTDDEIIINSKTRKFGEKVMMYIWEDIAKMNPEEWFSEYNSYENLLKAFNENSQKVIDELLNGTSQNV